jgi:hypothetical protein
VRSPDTSRRGQRSTSRATPSLLAALMLLTSLAVAGVDAAEEAAFRYRAPIEVERSAPFIELALAPDAYARSAQPGLRDLRIVDARGARVPHALLGARSELRASEQSQPAMLYPLPARPDASGTWQAPVEVVVDGDRVRVRRGAGAAADATAAGTGSAAAAATAIASGSGAGATAVAAPGGSLSPGGWIVDLGERKPEDPVPRWLRLRWSGPAEFTAGFRFETSDDLRIWRGGGTGQVMALASPAGPLTQPSIALPPSPGRFVRLLWSEPRGAPVLTGADVVTTAHDRVAIDAPDEIVLAPVAAPADRATLAAPAADALYFDLGGVLPALRVGLRFARGTHVAPVRLQGRDQADDAWRDLAQGVFYRLERAGEVATAPLLTVDRSVRFVRVVPDPRAAALDGAGTQLVVQAQLERLVFAAQGEPPYALLAGAAQAPAGALPVATLVPDLANERARFGLARLGAWIENEAVARRLQAERRAAQWRPWLLWTVLLFGIAGLGFMVWRLAASGREPARGASRPDAD